MATASLIDFYGAKVSGNFSIQNNNFSAAIKAARAFSQKNIENCNACCIILDSDLADGGYKYSYLTPTGVSSKSYYY